MIKMDFDIKMCKTSNETPGKQLGWTFSENVWKIFGCMQPVLSFIGKSHMFDINKKDSEGWEIPFEVISGMISGSQFLIANQEYCC